MRFKARLYFLFFLLIACAAGFYGFRAWQDMRALRQIIERLCADTRVAEVIVTGVKPADSPDQASTTIKFMEYDAKHKPLKPRYFTFSSNIIQFQSMVIRFDDFYIKRGHPLKGKSAYIFMKAFALSGGGAEVFEINRVNEVPSGYSTEGSQSLFEKNLWKKFWQYALDPKEAKKAGIKNAQIEAPGTRFIPGMIYTLKIEHDGGLRIDAEPIPAILSRKAAGSI